MIPITNDISLNDDEITFSFTRSSGPGGQNVNKVSSAVQLRFNIHKSRSLPNAVKKRLIGLAGKRVTSEGVLVIDARGYRTQLRNREDAINRLSTLVKRASKKPKYRVPTGPTKQSRKKRLEAKRLRSDIKRQRKTIGDE